MNTSPQDKVNSETKATNLTATAGEELSVDEIFHNCDPGILEFETTDEVEDIKLSVGQTRAVDAIRFGVDVMAKGFNIFVTGSSGLGKHPMIQDLLKELPESKEPLSDWCYVHNFKEPQKPQILQLPAGKGFFLKEKVGQLIDDLLHAIPSVLQSDEFKRRANEIQDKFMDKEERALSSLKEKAKQQHFLLTKSSTGYSLLSERDGKALTPQEYDGLSIEEQSEIERRVLLLRTELLSILGQFPLWEKETRDQLKVLERQSISLVLDQLFHQLSKDFANIETAQKYIHGLKYSILDNIDRFSAALNKSDSDDFLARFRIADNPFLPYQVNVLVDNSSSQTPKVIYENNPTYNNLLGSIQHRSEFGTLITDFTLIKAGSLQKANGGLLILDAIQVLNKPYVWDALKRTLLSNEVRIQPIEQVLSISSVTSLEPEAIPLDIKVILVGNRMLYYLLKQYDPDFNLLFKVQADCSEEMDRKPDSCQLYAKLIKSILVKEKLRPLDVKAVANVIEFSSRRAADGKKLSLNLNILTSLLQEANYWARKRKLPTTGEEEIHQAISSREERAGYLKQQINESIIRGISIIRTDGEKTGEINALSIILINDHSFGRPSRISAAVQLGEGKVIDIEREVDLSGPSHSKGVMILSAFLGNRFGKLQPLTLSATLTFEQSYGAIEGDSASAAELCVLLSAIGQVSLKQSIAMTGAIDQHGNIEAVGGVNEKIEGFFEICQARGLTGEQGVIIPRSNMIHLMLKQKVRDAVAENKFRIWAVDNIDQAMSRLSGIPMGELDKNGYYPENSVNNKVLSHIRDMNEVAKEFAHSKSKSKKFR